jgi:Protein of unknown function (DUF2637)/DNA methylase
MALPVERRNSASVSRPAPAPAPDPEPIVTAESPTLGVPVWASRVTTASVLAVAGVAAVASYEHMRGLAVLAGEDWRAWLLPVSVDGRAVAASMTMLVRRRASHRVGALPWVVGVGAGCAPRCGTCARAPQRPPRTVPGGVGRPGIPAVVLAGRGGAGPFAGSGTKLSAARQLGRRAIGVEASERYCELAVSRLAQTAFDSEGGGLMGAHQ